MLLYLRTALLMLAFAAASSAQAQFKPVELPPPPMVPALPPTVQTLPPTSMNPPPAVLAPAPSPEPTPPMVAPPAAVMVPGCPGQADCPQQPETEGPLSEAAKEIIKEFVKCEVEGKLFDQCLLDDPPPTLSSLNDDERAQLTDCLGSQDLSATRDFWEQCVARLR